MNPEDRLRDAANAYSDPIQPAPDAWARIRERVDGEPHRRRAPIARLALAGVATAVVIAIVATLVAVVRDGEGDRGVTTTPASPVPAQIAAITDEGRLVVLDASTGAEVRELADDASTTAGSGNNVAVAPDGSAVYYARAIDATCAGEPLTEIARIDTTTGAVESVVGNVRYPALSPDGSLLAYTGIPNCSDAGRDILVTDLQTGEGRWFSNESWPIEDGIGFLSWAPDSRHVLFTPFDDPGGTYPRVLDTGRQMSLDQAPRVTNPDGTRIQAYYGPGELFIGSRCPATDEPQEVGIVTFDPVTGDTEQTLFGIPGVCSGQLVVPDPTGERVLVTSDDALYLWSVGSEPTRVAEGAIAAAWLPETQPPPEARAEIVAARSDGRLVVMDAATGAEIRTLADGLGAGTTLAVTPDGERIFFDRPSGPESDPPTEIVTVPTRGGEVDRLIGGAGQPTVSPDGRLLAFARYDPPGLQVVELPDSFDGWIPNVVGDGRVSESFRAVIGLSWAPGSRHLAFTVVDTPEGSPPRIAEVGLGMELDTAPVVAVSLPSCAVAAYLGDTGLLVGVSGDRVIAIDPASGREVRELFRGPGLGCARDRAPSSDPSGASVGYITQGPAPALYRWSEGDAEPTKVADGIVAAVWLPPRS